ncbi:FAD-binding protein [Rubneribacter badeniensis]|uniref:FAD-binding protein n=1 Tax=Rubneribacter badeniensis TaxID=2070688 RepID=A0A2K2U8A5_9ACTN|nr:FAD-binding protein [Rubneribacter badeniensis]OUO94559.1 FAD-binding dehydrogenase [Gordonibacter sp. An232A]PNV66557.1 FAD-binding protein [Rubneribacter badeniensis]CVH78427.1 Fumarate reductase flavoprotein subunit precursor [Coriobacteriaceae bacterium CHKCI002]HJH42255.1 FAD-binding protein [Rubneribacter badeniensis]
MGGTDVSRRSFLKGVGFAGLSAGAFGAFGAAGVAFADDASAGEAQSDMYRRLACDTNLVPVAKAACPGPRGPIGFEERDIAASEIARTEEFDIVVVGAGIGGLTASLKAAEEGAKVVCIEKMSKGRGCFECFGAVNAKCQEGTDIDKTALLDELYRSAYWRTRPEPARTYVDRSGEATDFWQEMLDKGESGFVISKVEEAPSTNGMPATTPLIDTELGFYDSPSLPSDADVRSGYSGIYVCLEMQEVAKTYDNLDLRFNTPGVQLVREGGNGRVTGVIAKSGEEYIRLDAAKGVILATGGYDANPELMEAWTRPEDYATSSWWNPGWGTTGDGHLMGIKVGAQMDPCPQPVMNFRWGNPDSFYDARTWNAIYFAIMVNGDGKRFVREDLPFQSVSNAQNAQPGYGKNCWQVFDETMFEGMEDAVEEFKGKGWLFEGSSPEELAKACGIDPQGLADTIERYNGFFERGVDEDFNRDLAGTIPFSGARFFALTTNSCILATVGGLMVDGSCRVLDTGDQVIEGLYAVGNASGGFFAGNYPRHIPGTSIGRAVTFGYVAAEHAVKGA